MSRGFHFLRPRREEVEKSWGLSATQFNRKNNAEGKETSDEEQSAKND